MQSTRAGVTLVSGFMTIAFLGEWSQAETPETWWKLAQDELDSTLKVQLNTNVAKNVIVFLGDGMGLATITAARILSGQLQGKTGEESSLHFDKFPHTGILKPYSNDMQVSESSASGTALFTGQKTNSETIGLNSHAIPKQCRDSNLHHIDGLLHWAQQAGKSTGLVSNTRVADSTPASLYANSADEDWEVDVDIPVNQREPASCKDISLQLIEDIPGKNINVVLGGGRLNFLPQNYIDKTSNLTGRRLDKRHLVNEWIKEKAQRNVTASYVENRRDLLKIDNGTDFLFGLFNPELMTFALDRDASSSEPSLVEMATKAVEVLRRNPNGFFLMVEAGLIDDAHHRALAAKALHETLELNKAVLALDELTTDEDTLLLVVSDHSHSLIFLGYQRRGSPILGMARGKAVDKKPYTSLLYASGHSNFPDGPRENITARDTEYNLDEVWKLKPEQLPPGQCIHY